MKPETSAAVGQKEDKDFNARKWLTSGGGGYEGEEDAWNAHSWTNDGLVSMLEAYREEIEEWWSLALAEANQFFNAELERVKQQRDELLQLHKALIAELQHGQSVPSLAILDMIRAAIAAAEKGAQQ